MVRRKSGKEKCIGFENCVHKLFFPAIIPRGYKCADPKLPGIGSRTSAGNFILSKTCEISSQPPASFLCGSSTTALIPNSSLKSSIVPTLPSSPLPSYLPTMVPSFSPTSVAPSSVPSLLPSSPAPSVSEVPLNVTIVSNGWQGSLSWVIMDTKNHSLVYAEAANMTYHVGLQVQEEVFVPRGRNYTFTIKDSAGKGISGPNAGYNVTLVYSAVNNGDEIILVNGDGQFGYHRSHNFTVPGTN